ncbi:MAG: thioesterase family protein [Anaeromyxobacter sp.]|nr:thioesterase family protein [Anaeromyxobacter sp.]MBL0275417.1 thioesterase family protein [Anaeromyxobacter sp.]
MARVQIDLPDTFAFATELTLRVDDLNYGGHLGNDRVLALAQEVRVRWLAGHGLSELDVGGAGLILADAAVIYRAEGRHGMVLRCELAVGEVRSRSLELLHRFTDLGSGREIARVKTGVLCFDYAARQVVTLTAGLRAALGC